MRNGQVYITHQVFRVVYLTHSTIKLDIMHIKPCEIVKKNPRVVLGGGFADLAIQVVWF